MCCRMLGSIPGLCPLDARITHNPLSCDDQKCPLGEGAKAPRLRTTSSWPYSSESQSWDENLASLHLVLYLPLFDVHSGFESVQTFHVQGLAP